MTEHPGTILKQRFMDPLDLSASELARGLGIDRSTVSRLLAGKQPLTPEMAARLGAFFRVPARWWIQMQADHDAQRVDADARLVADVTPWNPDPDMLLTPQGARRLDASNPRVSSASHGARTVRYDNGSVALVSEDR